MIAAAALAWSIQASNPVVELVDAAANYVSVQAIVKVPPLSGHERSVLTLIAETVTDDVDGYFRTKMLDMAGQVGDTLRVTLMPDHMRIQIGVAPSDVDMALGWLGRVLSTSRLPADSINKAIAEIPFRSKSIWATTLQPEKLDFKRIRRDEVVDLYHRIFRPENAWIAVGGPVQPGAAADFWKSRYGDWKVGKPGRPSFYTDPAPAVTSISSRETMIDLRGSTIKGSDPALPTKLLAVIALGSGKGSTMFERLREAKGWSYRQESVLWPSADGFVPRFIMATGDKTPAPDLAKQMKDELLQAVESWSEADVSRARGMAEGILTRGFEMSPLYFNPSWPITTSLHDRTFMAGYWMMKTGRSWDPAKLVGQMAVATVEDLKEAARDLLKGSEPHLILGTG